MVPFEAVDIIVEFNEGLFFLQKLKTPHQVPAAAATYQNRRLQFVNDLELIFQSPENPSKLLRIPVT